jgi:type II secretory ATPase GspE/PulE/Tfp pilus assembly ATPase PilB-like protein
VALYTGPRAALLEDQFPHIPRDSDASEPPAIRAVDRLHADAIRLRASDIHIEPGQSGGRVRMRVDGILHPGDRLPEQLYISVVSRIKLMAAMDIADRRQPQDGRYVVDRAGRLLDARVSSMPTIAGEKLVIRLLDLQAEAPTLESLGMGTVMLERYRCALAAAHGFIIVCGPTGSGKTTTLYASIAERDLESAHVCTVEDPVEVHMSGVAQVQVNLKAGLTFASAMRAFLRQDPNVIMLGEMRDAESADVAMSAALSGQLVLTTLHAADAVRAIQRLVELGLSRHALACGLSAIVGQRLVRRLCLDCRRPVPSERGITLYEPSGCGRCEGTGYRGRTGIFELLRVTHEMRNAMCCDDMTPHFEELATHGGYEPMSVDASRLLKTGQTSESELRRILGSVNR